MLIRLRMLAATATLAMAAITMPETANAAVLIVNANGLLTGATGVMVNGQSYGVEFVDGTCASVFGGCDSASDFNFQTETDALAAAQALIDQVFLDGPLGNFDSDPGRTFGCSTAGRTIGCIAFIPYQLRIDESFRVRSAQNRLQSFPDTVTQATLAIETSTTAQDPNQSQFVFARFSAGQFAAIPEPATWAMMLMGFGLIGGMVRSQNKITAAVKFV